MGDQNNREYHRLNMYDLALVADIVESIEKSTAAPPGFYWSVEDIKTELQSGESLGLWLGPKENGILLSFIFYRNIGESLEISLLATNLKQRSKGCMLNLLKHIIDTTSQEIWLEVHENNLPARNLYEKLGFKQVGERPQYYRDGGRAILYSYSRSFHSE